MKYLRTIALVAMAVLPSLANESYPSTTDTTTLGTQEATAEMCSLASNGAMCPACDRRNFVDEAGFEYTITCDYQIQGQSEEQVDGFTTTSICMEACDENADCFGVNFAPDGNCSILNGALTGLSRRFGTSNLLRIVHSTTLVSTSVVPITSTLYGNSATSAFPIDITATSLVPAPTQQCNLELTDLCPKCNDMEVSGKGDKLYRILCDNTFASSNGTYSIQEFSTPESCLADCDGFSLCEGAIFSNDRDCELAKGNDSHPVPSIGYTAFLPLTSTTPSVIIATSQTLKSSSKTQVSNSDATATILPVNSGCDLTALSCPACNGAPYLDQLNGSYTVLCDFKPNCGTLAKWRDGADSQEQCIQGCDQDVTCLAALWYPETAGCELCQQGLTGVAATDLPYIVLAADIDGGESSTIAHSMVSYITVSPDLTSTDAVSQTITDFPAPFPTTTADAISNATRATTSIGAAGPVGPVLWTSLPTSTHEGTFVSIATGAAGSDASSTPVQTPKNTSAIGAPAEYSIGA